MRVPTNNQLRSTRRSLRRVTRTKVTPRFNKKRSPVKSHPASVLNNSPVKSHPANMLNNSPVKSHPYNFSAFNKKLSNYMTPAQKINAYKRNFLRRKTKFNKKRLSPIREVANIPSRPARHLYAVTYGPGGAKIPLVFM
jgi:hypothetical protein